MAELALTATGIVLSPLLQVFFDRMASRKFGDFFRRQKLSDKLLRKLKIALLSVNAVLEDAEDRQFMETSVKEWLDELKDIVYDAEEILDEIATEDLQRKLDPDFETIASTIQIDRCLNFAYFPQGGLRASNLKVFKIEDCRSLRSLPEKMHILLPSLEELHIKDCPQVESFPEGGLPSNLNEICILNCDKLFASRMGWGLQNLPCVRRFTIRDKYEDVESFPEEGLLPANLTHLYINGFPNLKSLDKKGLQHITALKGLRIWECPKLKCMPEDGLPASLSTLDIYGCPLLKKELERKEGEEWRKIAHVPNKYM